MNLSIEHTITEGPAAGTTLTPHVLVGGKVRAGIAGTYTREFDLDCVHVAVDAGLDVEMSAEGHAPRFVPAANIKISF
jgi:hypothetical protein